MTMRFLADGPDSVEFYDATEAVENLRRQLIVARVGEVMFEAYQELEMTAEAIQTNDPLSEDDEEWLIEEDEELEDVGPDSFPIEKIEQAQALAASLIRNEFGIIEPFDTPVIALGKVSLLCLPTQLSGIDLQPQSLTFTADRKPGTLVVRKELMAHILQPGESPDLPLNGDEGEIAHEALTRMIEMVPRLEDHLKSSRMLTEVANGPSGESTN